MGCELEGAHGGEFALEADDEGVVGGFALDGKLTDRPLDSEPAASRHRKHTTHSHAPWEPSTLLRVDTATTQPTIVTHHMRAWHMDPLGKWSARARSDEQHGKQVHFSELATGERDSRFRR